MSRTGFKSKLGSRVSEERRREAGGTQKISSSVPRFVGFTLGMIACVFLVLCLHEKLTSGEVPWLFMGMAAAHLVAFAGCAMTWKQVWHETDYYHVSDFFRT